MSKYDWSNVPDIYKWIGTDISGSVYAYTNKPKWDAWSGSFKMKGGFRKLCNQYSVLTREDSLEERPK